MATSADVIIIGAGVIGANIALEMARDGLKTISIDKNPASGYGSTSGSCAIIRVHYSTWDGTAFAYEGYHYWRDWADYLGVKDERGMAEFRETGCLVMATEQNGFLNKHADNCASLDIPHERWDGQKIREKLSAYDLKSFYPPKAMNDPSFGEPNGAEVPGCLYFPTAGYVTDPQLATHNLQVAAEAAGGQFIFGKRVVEILKTGERISGVVLDDGSEVHAPIVINVAGPHSAQINEMAGALDDMTIKTRALKQEVTHVPAPDGFNFFDEGYVISDNDIGVYVRPEKGNHILIGSEDPECDPREWVDPDAYDTNFTDQWTVQAQRYAQRVPSLGIPGQARGVVELYDVSDDWIPIYDRSQVPGFYMAIGSSGNQFKNAPIAAKMMSALVQHCENGGDHDADPLHFELPYLRRQINTGFYSRKRTINPESSFSVLG